MPWPLGPTNVVTPGCERELDLRRSERKSVSDRWRRARARPGRLSRTAAPASAGSGRLAPAPSASPAAPVSTAGLRRGRERQTWRVGRRRHPGRRAGNCGLNAISIGSPSTSASMASRRLRLVAGSRRRSWTSPPEKVSRTGVLRSATSDDALDRLDERAGLHRGDGRGLGRQQRAVLGELAVEQPGRGAPTVALEAHQALAAPAPDASATTPSRTRPGPSRCRRGCARGPGRRRRSPARSGVPRRTRGRPTGSGRWRPG